MSEQRRVDEQHSERTGSSALSAKRRAFLSTLAGVGSAGLLTKGVVANTRPTADFSYTPSTPSPDEEVILDGTVSTDPDGEVTDWEWEVETADGDIYTEYYDSQLSFDWESAGHYEVTLTVTDDEGLSDTVTKTVEVENITPRADFSLSTLFPNPGEEVTLYGTESTDPDGEIVDWDWEIETADGDIYTEDYDSQPTYTWEAEGSYEVTLTVTDNGDRTNTVTKTVDVENLGPKASFSFSPSSPNPGDEVTFDKSEAEDPDGEIVD